MVVTEEQLKKLMSTITLAHMELDISDAWMLDAEYPEAPIDYGLTIVQKYYNGMLNEILKEHPDLDKTMYLRILELAKTKSVSYMLTQAHELVDRTTFFLLQDAEQTLVPSKYFEYESVEDFLASIADAQQEGTGPYHAWRVFLKEVVPACKKAGIPPAKVFLGSANARKTVHGLMPLWGEIKRQMHTGEMDPQQGEEVLREFIGRAANLDESSTEFKQAVDKFRGKEIPLDGGNRYEQLEGEIFAMPENQRWFLLRLNGDEHKQRMLIQAVQNLVEWQHKPMGDFLVLVNDLLEGKAKIDYKQESSKE